MIILYILIGAGLGYAAGFFQMRSKMYQERKDQEHMVEDGRRAAEKMKAEALKEVDEVLAEKKQEMDATLKVKKKELEEQTDIYYNKQKEIDSKWDMIETKRGEIDTKIADLSKHEEHILAQENDLNEKINREEKRLEALADMDAEEARRRFLEKIEQDMAAETEEIIRKSRQKTQEQLEQEARDQVFDIMQRYASECAESRTTSTVYLPSDEIKGRIIGRDGRNIRTIETLTGANILIDDTPETVVVSCFEPYRREIARKTLETLIDDGRIHPNRIHDVVNKVKEDIDRDIFESAQRIMSELNIPELSGEILKQIGKLKYRFNSAQNLLQNAKEVASFMGMMAAEFHMDVQTAKEIGLLHSIGKSLDEHTDDDHIKNGVSLLRRHGIKEEILEAISMQKQISISGNSMAQILKTAIALSSNRPGSRDENMEFYIRRLHQMEHIANSFPEVEDCMVMQAGRELIIHVNPVKADDRRSKALAKDIADKLEVEMSFPGPVNVVVVRESRQEEMIGG
ncbi:MAG: ribonuclease Y [Lentisphaeraceae bacterium]|nr:ribonuclease Y [Lentisphaeraceae bacterium]